MTRSIVGHTGELSGGIASDPFAHLGLDPSALEPAPVTDYECGTKLYSVTANLIDAAVASGVKPVGGEYRIGDINGAYIIAEHQVSSTADGAQKIENRIGVFGDQIGFYFVGSEIPTETGSAIDFHVHGESHGAPIEADEAQLSQQLAKTILDIAVTQCDQGKLPDAQLVEIAKPLIETSAVDDTQPIEIVKRPVKAVRRFGSGALTRFTNWVAAQSGAVNA